MWSPSGPIRRDQRADLHPRADHGPPSGHWFGVCSSSQRPRAPADDAGLQSSQLGTIGMTTAHFRTWAKSQTVAPTSQTSARLCQMIARSMSPSLPPWLVAAATTTIDCAAIIFPMTPPPVLADAIRISFNPSFLAVTFWRLPNRTLLDVSEPVTATPTQPSNVPNTG